MTKRLRKGPGRPWPAGADLLTGGGLSPGKTGSAASSQVLSQLRRAILHGDIDPGAWLRQTELAQHYEVSRTPVREALSALEREGLIRLVPNHGAQVTPLSLDAFEEIYALRSGIEGLAARKAAEVSDEGAHATLAVRLATLKQAAAEQPLLSYLETEWQLRVACYEMTGRIRLVRTIRNLRESAERYLRLAYRLEADVLESFEFHSQLIDAICRNDGVAAEAINRQALQWTLNRAWPVLLEQVDDAAVAHAHLVNE